MSRRRHSHCVSITISRRGIRPIQRSLTPSFSGTFAHQPRERSYRPSAVSGHRETNTDGRSTCGSCGFGKSSRTGIGWMLIDEAGQALPQAAVGAVMRAKRSIVGGDPLQIPPVVTLPERLNSEVCKFFKVDKSIWAAPEASGVGHVRELASIRRIAAAVRT